MRTKSTNKVFFFQNFSFLTLKAHHKRHGEDHAFYGSGKDMCMCVQSKVWVVPKSVPFPILCVLCVYLFDSRCG